MGLRFPNPVGLAAGLDKNAAHIDGLAALGFGFIEVGTVTPLPQPGNPPPRLFRLPEREALINRFGFNNVGLEAFIANVKRSRWRGILGINIGKNAVTPPERAIDDYEAGLRAVYAHASYVTINISSPNTKGLRTLQQGDQIELLLRRLSSVREELSRAANARKPLLLKVAPDLSDAERSKRSPTRCGATASRASSRPTRRPPAKASWGCATPPRRARCSSAAGKVT